MTSSQPRRKKPTGLGPIPSIDPNFVPLASPSAPRPAPSAPRAKPRASGKPRKSIPPPRKSLGTFRFVLTALACLGGGAWIGYEAQSMIKAVHTPPHALKVAPGTVRPGGSSAFTF